MSDHAKAPERPVKLASVPEACLPPPKPFDATVPSIPTPDVVVDDSPSTQ